jgi:hypothetical protein
MLLAIILPPAPLPRFALTLILTPTLALTLTLTLTLTLPNGSPSSDSHTSDRRMRIVHGESGRHSALYRVTGDRA